FHQKATINNISFHELMEFLRKITGGTRELQFVCDADNMLNSLNREILLEDRKLLITEKPWVLGNPNEPRVSLQQSVESIKINLYNYLETAFGNYPGNEYSRHSILAGLLILRTRLLNKGGLTK
ncbi:MAG: hypothetical protein Q8L68_03920, partial [Methylococcales bacterium]|nr:hypothetical protein [Methylococcales bacterium]